jgi:hypothetical protein
MECHRCPHADAVEAGAFKDVLFEDTPCAKCELLERPIISFAFDAGRPGYGLQEEAVPDEQFYEDAHFPEEVPEDEDQLPFSVLRDVVSLLLSLPPAMRDIVCWRFSGVTYEEIARRQGVSIAMVEKRQRWAMQRCPVLYELFAVKVARHDRRVHQKQRPNK